MFLLTFAACVAVCVANVVPAPSHHGDEAWGEYKQRFGKIYTSQSEEQMRYLIWRKEVSEIDLHNAVYGHQYQQGVNALTDMTEEEYEKYSSGLDWTAIDQPELTSNLHIPSENIVLPDTVDWVKEGYVTEVKNQGHCGSCYAFAATGSLEGAWYKKTGDLVSVSEQQIVDCSSDHGNHGCHGGWYQWAWHYLIDAGGASSERRYPYTAKQGKCVFNKSDVVAKVVGFRNIKGGEKGLQEALANVGPIAVAIDAHGIRRYKSGIFFDPTCSSKRLSHGVLAVGYGRENGQDYWLIKNSWGAHWGMSGFIKMARNKNNHCGIATRPAYPRV